MFPSPPLTYGVCMGGGGSSSTVSLSTPLQFVHFMFVVWPFLTHCSLRMVYCTRRLRLRCWDCMGPARWTLCFMGFTLSPEQQNIDTQMA